MSHIPSEAEEKLLSLEAAMVDYPLPIEFEIRKFPGDHVPRFYIEEHDHWERIIDTDNGMVTKVIRIYPTS